jgi:hypothetical protein
MGAQDSPVRHQTVRCATGQVVHCPMRRHVTQPLGLEQLIVGTFVFLWHQIVWWCTRHSGAPLTRYSDFCRDTVALSESTVERR